MKEDMNQWLAPLAWLYGTGVYLRNKFFDCGWLKARSYDIPTICVGNLAVGGTGKTPHIEYLIDLLEKHGYKLATLSRGYKRKTKGFIEADESSTSKEIGDEPYQMKLKYPQVVVSVDNDRCRGVEHIMSSHPEVDAVLLDDAFQHRYIKSGLNVLLTEYNRLFSDDRLMPVGRLREPESGKNRAQIVIVTKCPEEIKPIDFNIVTKRLNLYPYQKLFFSQIKYEKLRPLFNGENRKIGRKTKVLLISGIASPKLLIKQIQKETEYVEIMKYDDHHNFTKREIHQIQNKFHKLAGDDKIIVTTEKDAARLKNHPALNEELKSSIYVYPISIKILQGQQDKFNKYIIDYVRENSRNSSIPQR